MPKEQPKYLPLTNDLVFKRYFTTSKPLLLSLVNSFLSISDRVSDVTILNPNDAYMSDDPAQVAKQQQRQSGDPLILKDTSIPPHKPYGKSVILDLNVKLSNGENVNIEMQKAYQSSFLDRIYFYWSVLYGQDLNRGDDFSNLNPTHSLIFTNFTLFKGKHNAISVFKSIDPEEAGYQANTPMRLVTVELNKFQKSYHELIDMKQKWCYIMQQVEQLTAKQEAYLLQDGVTQMALEHLEEISKDEKLYWDFLARRKDQIAMQLERSGALEEGRVQGMQEKQRGIALNMLQKGIKVPFISEVTGLSVAEIKQLNGRAAD